MKRIEIILKLILWIIIGHLLGLVIKRFLIGLEPTTVITTAMAWLKPAVYLSLSGLVTLAILVYAKRKKSGHNTPENGNDKNVHDSSHKDPVYDPLAMNVLLPNIFIETRRYSLALVIGATLAIAFIPQGVLLGNQPESVSVSGPRTIDESVIKGNTAAPEAAGRRLMVLDGNRAKELVLFPHEDHLSTIDGPDSCGTCHHQNMPYDQNSSCFECHQYMDTVTDIFSHSNHIEKLGQNDGCVNCHSDPQKIRTRMSATPCIACHKNMDLKDAFIKPSKKQKPGIAVSYKDAMHGLCIACHQEYDGDLAECGVCHDNNMTKKFRRLKSNMTYLREK